MALDTALRGLERSDNLHLVLDGNTHHAVDTTADHGCAKGCRVECDVADGL